MMIRFVLLSFMTFFLSLPMMGQKKEINTARDQIKSGKNLDKAQQAMEKLLRDSANRNNDKIWTTLFDAVIAQYQQGNEKLYLKQQYDTAQIFNLTRQLFRIAEAFDSIEATPDEKGKVRMKYRNKNAEILASIRPNLYNGGAFFVRKQNYKESFDFFNTYLDCANQPLFAQYKYGETDKRLPQAAYWATYSAFKQNNRQETLRYADLALKDQEHHEFVLQYLAETYAAQKDTASYARILKEGFNTYPKNPYFFTRIVEYHVQQGREKVALNYATEALNRDSTNELYLFTKSTILLNIGHYEECIELCDKLLSRNDTLYDAALNAGLAYFNMAVALDKNDQRYRKNRSLIVDYYKKAKPYLEKYRQSAPDQKEKWALPLYTIYLNLNMGREFDEIDRLLRK